MCTPDVPVGTPAAWPAWNKPFKLSDFDSSDSEDEYSVGDYDETTTYDKKKIARGRAAHTVYS